MPHGSGRVLVPQLHANMARRCEHVSRSIRRMDQNIFCGNIEEEAVGESQLLNHVGSRGVERLRTEVRNAVSLALRCTPTDIFMMFSWLEDSDSATLQ